MYHTILDQKKDSKNILEEAFSFILAVTSLIGVLSQKTCRHKATICFS
jgi:hypothetical protein